MSTKRAHAGALTLDYWRLSGILLLVGLMLLAPLVFNRAEAGSLLGVRFGETAPDKTRIVFDLSGDVSYVMSGDGQNNGRLYVDVNGVLVDKRGKTAHPGAGLVESYKYEMRSSGAARFMFAFAKTAKIEEAFVIEPSAKVAHSRLVIDLTVASKQEFLASVPNRFGDLTAVIADATDLQVDATKAKPQKVEALSVASLVEEQSESGADKARSVNGKSASSKSDSIAVPTSPSKKAKIGRKANAKSTEKHIEIVTAVADLPVVVIDAGHGGGDPGAEGPAGTLEKSVTLAAALQFEKALKETGRYKVVLTRNNDSRLSLQQRYRLAREALPDLFISLHADANPNKTVRGSSIYTLSKQGVKRAAKEVLSSKDDHVGDLKMSEVPPALGEILVDVSQRETLNESERFAKHLIDNLQGVTKLVNNTHRQKDLRVLLAPDVPAVLFELAFLSNAEDEKNLISKKWRRKTIDAAVKAVDVYFAERDASSREAFNGAARADAG